jgi:hypothetical protein
MIMRIRGAPPFLKQRVLAFTSSQITRHARKAEELLYKPRMSSGWMAKGGPFVCSFRQIA